MDPPSASTPFSKCSLVSLLTWNATQKILGQTLVLLSWGWGNSVSSLRNLSGQAETSNSHCWELQTSQTCHKLWAHTQNGHVWRLQIAAWNAVSTWFSSSWFLHSMHSLTNNVKSWQGVVTWFRLFVLQTYTINLWGRPILKRQVLWAMEKKGIVESLCYLLDSKHVIVTSTF